MTVGLKSCKLAGLMFVDPSKLRLEDPHAAVVAN
jgi:hypothetical protein